MWSKKSKVFFVLYELFGKHLPDSAKLSLAMKLRCFWARKIVKHMGKEVNVEKGAYFTPLLSIGDYSGVGINCELHGDITIGTHVMMAPEVVIYTKGHNYERRDTPMIEQGDTQMKQVTIQNDVWIGRRTVILPGVTVGNGAIIGACAVVTKNVEPYTIVAGNPAKIVKKR